MKGISVFEMSDSLRRAAFIERTSIRNLCGWFLAIPAYEDKHVLGHHVWTHAEHANWLRDRLQHLRGGHPDASIDPALLRLMDLIRDSDGPWAFMRATYDVLLPTLLEYYRELIERCDASANASDIRILKRVIPELEDQITWGSERLGHDPDPTSSESASDALRRVIYEIGGLNCPTSDSCAWPARGKPFSLPGEIVFDDRISDLPLMSLDERKELPYEDGLREQFYVFFNEMYAGAMLAGVLYEAIESRIDWRLIYGLSRHFWDEVRHSEFGAVRLRELGFEPDRCNQELFKNGLHMPLLHRICYLTMVLEPYYMPRKKPRFKEYEAAGDARSLLFADHDWSDEINHVRFGKDVLEILLRDDARDVGQLKKEVLDHLERKGAETGALSPF